MDSENKNKKSNAGYGVYFKYAAVGMQMTIIICIFAGGGYYIDKRFDVRPFGILIGALVGSAGAMTYGIRQFLKL